MQASIFLMISVASALSEGRVEGNAFQVQTRIDGGGLAEGSDTKSIRVKAVGVHRPDGSIADDVTLNWILGSMMGLANAQPRPIELKPAMEAEFQALSESIESATSLEEVHAAVVAFEAEHGFENDSPVDGFPQGYDGHPMSVEEVLLGGHISPMLIDVTGQAVDDGVIFPAQYGSPDLRTEGWYWSATVDTNKVGLHHCDLHIRIHRPRLEGSTIVWERETHVLVMELEVGQLTQINGFTGGGIGYLPLIDPAFVEVVNG